MHPVSVHRMEERAYRAHPALSRSLLEKIRYSPAHLKRAEEAFDADTEAFRFGRLVHSAILEPETFWPTTMIFDGAVRRGKAWEAFQERAVGAGKEILTVSEESQLLAMADAAERAGFRVDGHVEGSIFWKDARTEIECKARLDLIAADGEIVYDLKTTSDASDEGFLESVINYGYHRQAAWYLDAARAAGFPARRFVLIALEKKTNRVNPVEILAPMLDLGQRENERNLGLYALCKSTNTWPENTGLGRFNFKEVSDDRTSTGPRAAAAHAAPF